MKKLLICLSLIANTAFAQQIINLPVRNLVFRPQFQQGEDTSGDGGVEDGARIAFTPTPIPFSNADIISPSRAVEYWNDVPWDNEQGLQLPTNGNTTAYDRYYRFLWIDMENATQGTYSWTVFDQKIREAIDAGQKFSFGVMPFFEGQDNAVTVGGGKLGYPTYLHTLMQSDLTNNKDWTYSDAGVLYWIPNWNSQYYLARWEALLNAIAAHINATTYSGIAYKDIISYVDIRGYGNFGEWHNYPWYWNQPTGRTATVATLERIINSHITAFPDYPLMIISGAFDGGNASLMPAEASYYALTAHNNWGLIGWRRDNWGAAGTDNHLINNPYSYSGHAFQPIIMDRWKYARVGGEPLADPDEISNSHTQCYYYDLGSEVRKYHASFFGNGNYPSLADACARDSIKASSKACGYRIIIDSGSVPQTIYKTQPFNIKLAWRNTGIAPVYDDWNIIYQLKTGSTVVWSDTSAFKLKLFLPASFDSAFMDNVTVPGTVTAGTYSLNVTIRDPKAYRIPFPLAINGRNADGSYTLTTVTVSDDIVLSLPPITNDTTRNTVNRKFYVQNPAQNDLVFGYYSAAPIAANLYLYDMQGRMILKKRSVFQQVQILTGNPWER